MTPIIRLATVDDLAAINAIYNYYVLNSSATYQTQPATAEERLQWFQAHGPAHPIIVLESPGATVAECRSVGASAALLGWASLSPFHSRAAYRFTVENSVYIHPEYHRRGFGRRMLSELIARARVLEHHTIIAGIDAEQTASVALHTALGFTPAARLEQVGFKFDRWLDVVYLQLLL